MTDEREGFLERWSRRKISGDAKPDTGVDPNSSQALQPRSPDIAAPSAAPEEASERAPAAEPASVSPPAETVDLSDLPSIDSIVADTDVRGFLRPGVPPDLTRAALRRAWTNDPAIRDFVGLVENGWDFNDPDSIPGFGRINAAELSQLLGQAIGALPETPEAELEAKSAMQEGDDVHASERVVSEGPAAPEAEADGEVEASAEILQRNTNNAVPQKNS